MSLLPKTVRLFLMDGSADGRWIAELSNWTGKAYKIPRSMLNQSKDRADLQSPGIYLLFGRSDELGGKDHVYIGEAENIYERLKQHASGKDFWFEVITFISKDENLNKAHIKYLESRLYQLAKEADRFCLENTAKPTRSKISEADEAEMEEFLRNIHMFTSILGHKVFEPLAVQIDSKICDSSLLFIKSARGADGSGQVHPEGFIVFKGSFSAMEITVSFKKHHFFKLRQRLIDEGVLFLNNDYYEFATDYVFNSASAAAAIVQGRSANGLKEWKTKDGKDLKSLGQDS